MQQFLKQSPIFVRPISLLFFFFVVYFFIVLWETLPAPLSFSPNLPPIKVGTTHSLPQYLPFNLCHSPPPFSFLSIFLPLKPLPQRPSHMADAKDSSLAMEATTTSISPQHRTLLMAQDILRLLAIVLSAASIAVMVTNNQTVFLFSLPLEAHFYYSSSFK